MSSAYALGAEMLACAFTLAGTNTPTPAELTAALAEMYPGNTGLTVPDLLAVGWLVPAISDRNCLRLPPLTPAELDARLTAAEQLDKPRCSDTPPPPESKLGEDAASPQFSYFTGPITNTTPRATITVGKLHHVIIRPPTALRQRADAARAEYATHGKSLHYKALKNGLDYFTAGGTFTRRQDAAIVVESGLLTLDFDGLGDRLAEARAQLLADTALAPALALVFTSPSGDGLKAVLAADPRHTRRANYERLARHLAQRYGWGPTLDAKTADVSRACFLSHDPTAWLAPAYAAL
jgi:hypothetical protein